MYIVSWGHFPGNIGVQAVQIKAVLCRGWQNGTGKLEQEQGKVNRHGHMVLKNPVFKQDTMQNLYYFLI